MSYCALRSCLRICALVALVIGLPIGSPIARADTELPVLATILELNRKAINDYDNLNFDEARADLKEALALCDRNALGNHPVRARTYVNLGVVLLAADAAHPEVALAHFRRAFQIQPDVQLPVRLANPEVTQAFVSARPRGPTPTPTPPTPMAARVPAAADDGAADAVPATQGRTTSIRAAAATADQDDAEEDDAGSAGVRAAGSHWLLGFGVGSGFGWVSGNGEVNSDLRLPSGFEPSSVVHLSPEVGYFLRPDLEVSLQGRFQLITGATAERDPTGMSCGADRVCSPSKGATAVFLKATWFSSTKGLRPFLSGAIGYGQIRHVVTLSDHTDCGADAAHPTTCVDTATAGPIFIGPGAGVMIDLARHFALTLGVSTLVGISTFTFHVDVAGGVAVEL
jgi:hypothetical protein